VNKLCHQVSGYVWTALKQNKATNNKDNDWQFGNVKATEYLYGLRCRITSDSLCSGILELEEQA